jgi:hypothetical protein
MPQVPNRSDIILKFSGIVYNSSDDSIVDLDSATDIICSISRGNPNNTPLVVLKNTDNPELFSIDNTAKTVEVTLTNDNLGDVPCKYFVNLWILTNGRYMTHLTKTFEVVESVAYEA